MSTNNDDPQLSTRPAPGSTRPGCWSYVLLAAVGAISLASTLGSHTIGWLVDQILVATGVYSPHYTWVVITALGALIATLTCLPLSHWVKTPRFRVIYRTWAIAAASVIVLSVVRFFPVHDLQLASFSQLVLLWIEIAVLLRLCPRPAAGTAPSHRVSAALAAPLLCAPFVVWGALGSPLDTLLTGAVGLSFGYLASLILTRLLFQPFALDGTTPGLLLAGFAAGVALTILAAGLGLPGSQLLLLLALPTIGLYAAALSHPDPAAAERSSALVIGSAAAATLMFFDPAEINLILGLAASGEVLSWALRAAGVALVIGVMLVVCVAVWRRTSCSVPAPWGTAVAAAMWSMLVLLYVTAGQPGFHGDAVFAILKDQADLGAAPQIVDRDERLRSVYTTLTRHAAASQAPLRQALDRFGLAYRPYYLVNAIEVTGGPLVRALLARQPQVDRVIASPRLRPLVQPLADPRGDQAAPQATLWNVRMIGADRVWNELGVTGRGVIVGQSDTGVDGTHPALSAQYRGKTAGDDYNWLDPWNHSRAPADVGGHGTHTLGSILGRDGIGIAPDAEWFGCVNLGRDLGNAALYLDCLQFMLAPYPRDGNALVDGDPARAAHVINNSWGCPPLEGCDPLSLEPAVHALRMAGIFVVVSAGNDGPRCGSVDAPPAIYADAFSVGAVAADGRLAEFSSRGPVSVDGSERVKPDIVAPGEDVISSYPGGTYYQASGTSMAGPHIAGVVALMWSANPKLIGQIEATEQILRSTARPLSGPADACAETGTPNNASGYGLVDAYAAVQAARAFR